MQLEGLRRVGETELRERAALSWQEAFESARESGKFRCRWVRLCNEIMLRAFQVMASSSLPNLRKDHC